MTLTFAKDYFKKGSHNVICDRCGTKHKAEELKREWQGFMVCEPCFEPRHPQDFLRSVPDQRPRAYYRPEGIPEFVLDLGDTTLTAGDGDILTAGDGDVLTW